MEAALGRPLTEEELERLDAAIAAAQLRISAALGWVPMPPTRDTFVLRGNWSRRIRLPRRPVLEIISLSVNGFDRMDRDVDGPSEAWQTGDWWFAPPDELAAWNPGTWGGSDGWVEVDYLYGFEELPPDLAGLTAEWAALALSLGGSGGLAAQAGIQSESLGPYRVAFTDPWKQAGAAYGGADAILARYGPATAHSIPMGV